MSIPDQLLTSVNLLEVKFKSLPLDSTGTKCQKCVHAYYSRSIPTEKLIPCHLHPRKVSVPAEVVYFHENAPCHKAHTTQVLPKDYGSDFFGRAQWPGDSPDRNVAEDVGSILTGMVKSLMINEYDADRNSEMVLLQNLHDVLHELENGAELFENCDVMSMTVSNEVGFLLITSGE